MKGLFSVLIMILFLGVSVRVTQAEVSVESSTEHSTIGAGQTADEFGLDELSQGELAAIFEELADGEDGNDDTYVGYRWGVGQALCMKTCAADFPITMWGGLAGYNACVRACSELFTVLRNLGCKGLWNYCFIPNQIWTRQCLVVYNGACFGVL